MLLGLDFPPISHLTEWDGFAFDGWMDSNGHEGIDRFVEVAEPCEAAS